MGEEVTLSRKIFLPEEPKIHADSEMAMPPMHWQQEPEDISKGESMKILDPEDPLMKRFQDALKTHLMRIDKKLSEDIADLENGAKEAKKKRESKATELYAAQVEIARQHETLDKYKSKLGELTQIREENECRVNEVKEMKKRAKEELDKQTKCADKLAIDVETLGSLNHHFGECEKEIANHLTITKRMSEKDASVQREMLQRKQYEDYILSKLMEEVNRLNREIIDCRQQLQLKHKEKLVVHETMSDVNADLEGLQSTQKILLSYWNRAVMSISQRDKVNEELANDRAKIRESFASLTSQIDKLKKDTNKEIENNERLTSVQTRLEDDIRYTVGTIANDKEKYDNLECQIIKTTKLLEQTQNEYDSAYWEYQNCVDEEKGIDKDLEKLTNEKVKLEDEILAKLEDKVTSDKTVKSLNKTLRESQEKMREEQLMLLQSENVYGKHLLEIEKLNALIINDKYDLDELLRTNTAMEKKLDAMQSESNKCDLFIEKKQQKIVTMNRKIEEIISSLVGGEEASPQDLKINELEKNIEETQTNIRKSQEFWLRQEGYMVTLSEQRTTQLQEISLIGKQIMIMEQKNVKLEHELEKQKKEDETICRNIKLLQQKLVNANARLAAQREVRDDLEDKNCMTKGECIEALREAEVELSQLQSEIRQSLADRMVLEEQLKAAQRETLSWEKKVRLASETAKKLKEERCAGGDVAVMKNEIHKMEMRLSHLRKAQEKMIRDMEFCVARRDVIMDGAMAREKRNPKGQHNQRVVFEKRMYDQKLKIKQMAKESKQMENQISELEGQQNVLEEQLKENQKTLQEYEDAIPDIDKQIVEGEFIKQHKLECLVRKQRKVRMLQDVKDGRYKMVFKSELMLYDELHKQQTISNDLKEIMEETRRDFPLLKDSIRKITLVTETS